MNQGISGTEREQKGVHTKGALPVCHWCSTRLGLTEEEWESHFLKVHGRSGFSIVWQEDDANIGPLGNDFIAALQDAGIVPRYAQKVVIEAAINEFVRVHVTLVAQDGDKLLKVIAPAAHGAEVIVHDAV